MDTQQGARLDLRNGRGKTAYELARDMRAPSDLVEALCDQQHELTSEPWLMDKQGNYVLSGLYQILLLYGV